MWRHFQGLPRVLRSQWSGVRSSPAVRCGDEEGTAEKCYQGLCVTHHQVKPFSTTHDIVSRSYHTDRSRNERKTGRDCGYSCSCRQDATPGSDHQKQSGGDGKEHKDNCGRSEYTDIPKHSYIEALGWSATLAFGVELIHYWHAGKRDRGDFDERKRCWTYHLSHAYTHGRGVARSVLPKNGTTNVVNTNPTPSPAHSEPQQPLVKAYKFDSGEFVTVGSDDWSTRDSELEYDLSEKEDDSHEKKVTFDPSTPECDILFAEAEHEWKKLESIYHGAGLNDKGMKAMEDGQREAAFQLWMKAAEIGYGKALYNLGVSYESGIGTEKNIHKAAETYAMASMSGHPQAIFNLGVMTLTGKGVATDTTRGVLLIERAASLGLPEAQREAGVLYMEQERRDEAKAAAYFQQAAKQGDTAGEYYAGLCYENGIGVRQDLEKAEDYYFKASEKGHGNACYSLAKLQEQALDRSKENKDETLHLYEKAFSQGIKKAKDDINRLTSGTDRKYNSLESLTLSNLLDDLIPSPTDSVSSIRTTSSSPSLSSYLQQNILENGFSDFHSTQNFYFGPDVKKKPQVTVKNTKVSISLGSSDTESDTGSAWSLNSGFSSEDSLGTGSGSRITDLAPKDSTGRGDTLVLSGGFGNIPNLKKGTPTRRVF